jgi:SAM-dependent methyltransferase
MPASASRADRVAGGLGATRPPLRPSVLKRRKVAEISRLLGATTGLRCLDLGGDNGVVSYLLRQGGGQWTSADLDQESVDSIRRLVGDPVHRLEPGRRTPFDGDAFDRVVVVDLLEHLQDDRGFVDELFRILRPGGELIVNVPHRRDGLLRRLRLALGQTDEQHGHVRPGYTADELRARLRGRFEVVAERTYNKTPSELLDIVIRALTERIKGPRAGGSKGVVLVDEDFRRHRGLLALYAVGEPALRAFTALDGLFVLAPGHILIVKATSLKRAPAATSSAPEEEQRR